VSREPGSGTREFTDELPAQLRASPLEQMNMVMELGSPIALNGVVETGTGFRHRLASASVAQGAAPGRPRRHSTQAPADHAPCRWCIRRRSSVHASSTTFVDFAAAKLKELSLK
jgi:hypothetical protein